MRLTHALLAALSATAVLGLPTAEVSQAKGSFLVKRVATKNFSRNGPAALVKAYGKYGIAVSDSLKAARSRTKGSTGASTQTSTTGTSTDATNSTGGGDEEGGASATGVENDSEYVVPVMIGGQQVMLDFDSGSSDLWVMSTTTPADDTTGHTNLYDPSSSSTFQELTGATWNISYADGSGAAGTVGTDTVNVGGVTVTGQAVELPTAVSGSFVEDTNSNGLMGLAFSTLNTVQPTQQQTFFANAVANLDQPVFTADLESTTGGSYEFGAIDASKFSGNITYTAVDSSSGFWMFDADTYTFGTQTYTASNGVAIADTGTTLLLVNPELADAYYEQIDGAENSEEEGGYIFPCSTTPPDVTLMVGTADKVTINGTLMNFATTGTDNMCYGAMQSNGGTAESIYGDTFFRSAFVVFDMGSGSSGPQLGVAAKAA